MMSRNTIILIQVLAILVVTTAAVSSAAKAKIREQVFTDFVSLKVKIGDEPAEWMKFGLYGKIVPRTTKNFKELVRGTMKAADGTQLAYKGSTFHRIIPNFMAQGGDFTRHNGTGGMSIYGEKFEDENFDIPHSSKGLLSMANAGTHTNGSQFFITFTPTHWLDNRHVVFGKIIGPDSEAMLQRLETVGSNSGTTLKRVVIEDTRVDEEGVEVAAEEL